jgi:hypothetical protein
MVGRRQGPGHALVGGAAHEVRVRALVKADLLLRLRLVDGQAEAELPVLGALVQSGTKSWPVPVACPIQRYIEVNMGDLLGRLYTFSSPTHPIGTTQRADQRDSQADSPRPAKVGISLAGADEQREPAGDHATYADHQGQHVEAS